MAIETTFAIIKPDAVARNLVGEILSRAERAGLKIVGMRMGNLTRATAERLYEEHRGKEFFDGQVGFMESGPVVAVEFSGEDAIRKWREIMGPTDKTKASAGTIRHDLAETMRRNCVHGSDSTTTACRELQIIPDLYADL